MIKQKPATHSSKYSPDNLAGELSMNPQNYLKAIAGTLISGLGSAKLAMSDDVITGQEWLDIALVSVTAFCSVYGITNHTTGKRVAP